MHADLVKLLDLQSKDAAVAEAETRLRALDGESAALDQAIQRARDGLDARAARRGRGRPPPRRAGGARSRATGLLQDRRVQRLETVRNPKEASTLMAELDLARSVIAKEENDWVRQRRGGHPARAQGERGGEQGGRGRARRRRRSGPGWPSGGAVLEAERDAAVARRARRAPSGSTRPLRTRYDRLRRSRRREVVVPLVGRHVRGVPHVGPAQSPEPDPQRGHHRRLRGMRRDPVPRRTEAGSA